MRKHKISLILFQLLASTIVMMAEANTGAFDRIEKQPAEEKDLESELSQERDLLPDLLGFAAQFYQ
jgi:hypothetical protein